MNEIEVRDALFRITGVNFEIREPDRRDLDHFGKVRWFVVCREVTEARKIPYVNIAWADRGNAVWLESVEIGEILDWIYQHYGDAGLARAKKINLEDFPSLRAREELGNQFPKVMRQLEMYEESLKNSSTKHGVQLEMRYQNGKETTSFRLAAKIAAENEVQPEFSEVKGALEALSEAYDNICRHEARIL